MTTNKVSSESPFYFQLIHVNNIWNIKTVFMQNGYRLQWYGIFPLFLIQYLAQLGLLLTNLQIMTKTFISFHLREYNSLKPWQILSILSYKPSNHDKDFYQVSF